MMALDCAGESGTARNRPAFPRQTLFWSGNLLQERSNSMEPVQKKEIPVYFVSCGDKFLKATEHSEDAGELQ